MNAISLPKPESGRSSSCRDRAMETRLRGVTPEVIRLPRRAVRSLDLANGQHLLVAVSGGIAWATMEGDPDDYTLSAASPFPVLFSGPGRLVIEAVEGDLLLHVSTPG